MFNTESQMNPVRNPLQDSVFNFGSIEGSSNPPPFDGTFWITNLGEDMIANTLAFIVFGGPVPPPDNNLWVDNFNDYMIDSDGDYLIFGA